MARAAVRATYKPSIFADPLNADEVDRYLATWRGAAEATVTPLPDRDATSMPAAA